MDDVGGKRQIEWKYVTITGSNFGAISSWYMLTRD